MRCRIYVVIAAESVVTVIPEVAVLSGATVFPAAPDLPGATVIPEVTVIPAKAGIQTAFAAVTRGFPPTRE